ncbi:MAG TPA: hypothetical protein VGZ49_05195 [Xanthobacteraceae bacterium]|jgi:hypothetical protein|nr:hypothetical protein [Xanthobacteraceae bacterium]
MVRFRNRAAGAAAAKSGETTRPRPILSLTWTLDPSTGKPVGRWVVEAASIAAVAVAA